jgi:hypothetical protein
MPARLDRNIPIQLSLLYRLSPFLSEICLILFFHGFSARHGGHLPVSRLDIMIDYTLFGLNKQDVDEYHKQICCLLGKSVLLVLTANKPITKQNLLACLIQEVEKQPDDYFQRLHRAAIEMIGVNGR